MLFVEYQSVQNHQLLRTSGRFLGEVVWQGGLRLKKQWSALMCCGFNNLIDKFGDQVEEDIQTAICGHQCLCVGASVATIYMLMCGSISPPPHTHTSTQVHTNTHTHTLSLVVCVCNPSAGEKEIGESLWLTGQLT